MKRIDLNCDMGELPEAISDGTQESLMPHLTSVNIACGGHAGDPLMMQRTIKQALRWHVAIGAHPGYADRANFGRVELAIPLGAVADFVFEQVRTLGEIAAESRATITHVKPHGALAKRRCSRRPGRLADAWGVSRRRLSRCRRSFRRPAIRVGWEAAIPEI